MREQIQTIKADYITRKASRVPNRAPLMVRTIKRSFLGRLTLEEDT